MKEQPGANQLTLPNYDALVGGSRRALSHWTLENVFLACAVLSMAFFGFATRFLGKANNLVDALMIGGALLVLGGLAFGRINTKEPATRLFLAAFLVLLLGLVTSFAQTVSLRAVIQVLLYAAYLLPLIWVVRLSPRDAYHIFLPLLLLICLVQLPVDLLFPQPDAGVFDVHYGTFTSPNMKSRFLMLALPVIALVYRKRLLFNRVLLPILLIPIAFSLYLGFAKSAYLVATIAIVSSLLHKHLLLLAGALAIFVAAAMSLLQIYATEPVVYMNVSRFLDPEHGAYAIVLYGIDLLKESWFFGVGYGEFISRTAQTMGGAYVSSVPRTMISWGTIYDNVIAPLGVPAFISILTEGGLLGGGVFYILYSMGLFKLSHPSKLGFALFAYIMLVALFMPMYFEVAEGAVLTYTFAIASRALYYTPPGKTVPA